MLTLPIKKKWFDMILSGEKKEEYREIKPYWDVRICNEFGMFWINGELVQGKIVGLNEIGGNREVKIMFRNGYRKDSPSFVAKCTLSVGTGKEEWGAEPGKEYFVLTVQEIIPGGTGKGRFGMKQKQSAKDLAFEKERVKFRKKIRELEREINALQLAVMQKDNELNIVRNELSQKEDWIRRLLEYTELSENDMKAIIDKEKSVATAMKRFGELGNILVSGMGRL